MRASGLSEVYITGSGAALPGPPIPCEAMEDHLGQVNGRASLLGRRALRWNGVRTRHYAIDASGKVTDSNAGMCAKAALAALEAAGLGGGDLSLLAAATTQGDRLAPGHAAMVHGELAALDGTVGPLEIHSFQSVCGSALMAARAAWSAVRTGEHAVAVACAGEFSSRWFRPAFYEGTKLIDAKGRLRMEADFLRFTLSDGAGAAVFEPSPRQDGLSLRVDWMELVSLAHAFDPCMWAGATDEDRSDPTKGWAIDGPAAAHAMGAVALLQDFNLLKRVIRAWVGVYLQRVEAGRIVPARVDHLLCHYSAASLREEIVSLLEGTAGMIPAERWFSVLAEVGNVGSASIYVMLDALLRSGRVKRGDRVLCVVPESGRAFVGFMMLEAV